jgi:hypothetical protein
VKPADKPPLSLDTLARGYKVSGWEGEYGPGVSVGCLTCDRPVKSWVYVRDGSPTIAVLLDAAAQHHAERHP